MAKAEPLRDYYKDLEIQPDAELDDIKKQYRKLALKFHPDRNRGHEEQASIRFQEIQAANEILTDPQERAKYDASRRRAAGLSSNRASNLRRNPYENTPYYPKSDYPPPPRRAPATGQQRPAFTSSASAFASASSGSRRYQPFTTAFGTGSAQDGPRQAPKTPYRTNSPEPIYSTSPPKTRAQRTSAAGPPPNLNRSQSTRVPRPGAFDPHNQDQSRDEPPAAKTASAYANIARGRRAAQESSSSGSSSESSPEPRAVPRGPPVPPRDPRKEYQQQQQQAEPPPALPKRTTTYSSVGGDRTHLGPDRNVFSESFARSAGLNSESAQRQPAASSHSYTAQTPGSDRHRSASPPRNRYTTEHVSSSSRQNGSAGNTPRRTNSAEDPSSRSRQKGPSTSARSRPGFPFEESDTSEDDDRQYNKRNETMEQMADLELHRRNTKKGGGPQRSSRGSRLSNEYGKRERGSPRVPSGEFENPQPPSNKFESMNLGGKTKSRENSTLNPHRNDSKSSHDGRSHHADASNSRFSAGEWTDRSFFPNGTERRDSTQSDRRGRPPARPEVSHSKSPKNVSSEFSHANGASSVPLSSAREQDSSRPHKFTESEWQGFNADFTGNPADLRTSPVRGSQHYSSSSTGRSKNGKSRKPVKPSKRSGMSKQADVIGLSDADEDDNHIYIGSRRNGYGRSSGHSSGRDSGAMDIDPPEPQPQRTESFDRRNSASTRTHTESYDRSRPEYRKEASYQVNGAGSGASRPVPPIPHAPSPPQEQGAYNMSGFKNVQPIGRSNGGLQDMKDMATDLPFEARASAHPPNFSDSERQQLPKPPRTPDTRLAYSDWNRYVQEMRIYMAQWDDFNKAMLRCFEKNDALRSRMGTDWASNLKESEKAGYFRYAKTIDEDMLYRKHWAKECEAHQQIVKAFGAAREQVRKTTEASGRR